MARVGAYGKQDGVALRALAVRRIGILDDLPFRVLGGVGESSVFIAYGMRGASLFSMKHRFEVSA